MNIPPDRDYENESQLVAETLIAFGSEDWLWIWRENTGVAYGMSIVKFALKKMMEGQFREAIAIIKQANPIVFGIPGRADISGITNKGRMVGMEAKIKHRPRSTDQKRWAAMFIKMGGLYIHFEQVSHVYEAFKAEGYITEGIK